MKVFEKALKEVVDPSTKQLTILNSNKRLVEKYEWMHGLNLRQIYKQMPFMEIEMIITQTQKGDTILSLGLELDEEIILIPFSRGKDEEFFTNDATTFKNKIWISNRKDQAKLAMGGEIEAEENLNPTGPLYISYGAAGELNVISRVTADEAAEPAPAAPAPGAGRN